jgi:cobalt-zinc-cadmium efflux system outer membrane protein
MPTRAQACAWIAVFGLLLPAALAAQDRTEREIVDLIVRDGPQAAAIRAEAEITRRAQLARLAYPNPELSYTREGAGFTEFLQLGQALPAFGQRAALARAGVAASAAADAERDERLWVLRTNASVAAARLLAGQALLISAEAHTRDIARLIEILRTREREGEGSRFDRLRAEQERWDARQLVTSAAIAVGEARATISAMLPRNVTVTRVSGSLYTPQPPTPPHTLISRATLTRASLRALQSSAEYASWEATAARRARLPAPTIMAGLKRADDGAGRERGGVFGLNLSLPVFDLGGREVARWTAERARVDAERASLERQIEMEIVRASEALALRQAAVEEDREAAGDELTQIAEVAYREGEVGILGLLDAFRTASRARMRAIDLRLDARLAQIALERAVGDVLWP